MFARMRINGSDCGLEALPSASLRRSDGSKYRVNEDMPQSSTANPGFVASPVRHFGSPVAKKFQQLAAGSTGPPAVAGCHSSAGGLLSDPKGMDLAARIQDHESRLHPLRPLPRPLVTSGTKPKALERMEEYVRTELTVLRSKGGADIGSYERLNVFRQTFGMFASTVRVYGSFLEGVVQEYEAFIRYLEQQMDTPGKAKQAAYKQFEAELQQLRSDMAHQLAVKEEDVSRRKTEFEENEVALRDEIERLNHENERLQQDLQRLHDQNLSLAHNLVDYRFQSQKAERELKEAEQLERRYRKLHAEHQQLLDYLAQGAKDLPPGGGAAALQPHATPPSGGPVSRPTSPAVVGS